MFPIYKARKFLNQINSKYGHTEPWVVLCEGEKGWGEFVVKIFTEDHLSEKPRVHGEFVGSWFANQFDFMTPDVAWIELDQQFLLSLHPEISIKKDLDDTRLKFGSRLVGPFQHFSKGMKKKKFQELLDLDTLYAFDNLIRNHDRGLHKPNLLVKGRDAYLIDHEYALDISDQTISQIKNLEIMGKFSTSHIAFSALSKANVTVKRNYFEMFLEYLRALNLQELESVLSEIEQKEYQAEVGMILDYFRFVKTNPAIFVSALKRTLQ
jgi:hypothetical protein